MTGLRGQVAIIGVGETMYYRRGESPDAEFVLALRAILAACDDAGIDPRDVDGFAAYADDRNQPPRLAAALGTRELRFSNMHWTWGGGGAAAAVGNAAAAILAGFADCVVVFRALAQGEFGRFGTLGDAPRTGPRLRSRTLSGEYATSAPYGALTPAQMFGPRATRFLATSGVDASTMRAVAMASYHHAQNNPRAVMYGRPLTEDAYESARWIAEPFRLYDCCLENDGAAAMVLVRAKRAADTPNPAVYLLGAAQGGSHRSGAGPYYDPDFTTAGFTSIAPRLFEQAQVKPSEVDVAQCYENFTLGVVLALIEHGLCTIEEANEFFTFENLTAPNGRLPLNTSGGNLAECYMHGLGLQIEAVRQLRGQSPNPVHDANVALATAGPFVPVTSSCIYGTAEVLS